MSELKLTNQLLTALSHIEAQSQQGYPLNAKVSSREKLVLAGYVQKVGPTAERPFQITEKGRVALIQHGLRPAPSPVISPPSIEAGDE